jgi:hypothetical protein
MKAMLVKKRRSSATRITVCTGWQRLSLCAQRGEAGEGVRG